MVGMNFAPHCGEQICFQDLLAQILNKVSQKEDRKSFSEVCKQWLRVEGSRVIGNSGVDALFQSAHNLKSLHLIYNDLVSDHVFRTIGSSSISTLVLTECPKVTDVGLGFLANGSTSKTLKKLIIEESCMISETGIHHLVKLSSLEHLELNYLSSEVTDTVVLAISKIQTLRNLKVSDIDGVSDQTVVALAENCRNLEALILCCDDARKLLPGASIHPFSSHKNLKHLALFGFINVDQSDVERVLVGCPSLESLVLDKSLIKSFGMMHENSARARRVVKYGRSEYAYFSTFMATTW